MTPKNFRHQLPLQDPAQCMGNQARASRPKSRRHKIAVARLAELQSESVGGRTSVNFTSSIERRPSFPISCSTCVNRSWTSTKLQNALVLTQGFKCPQRPLSMPRRPSECKSLHNSWSSNFSHIKPKSLPMRKTESRTWNVG